MNEKQVIIHCKNNKLATSIPLKYQSLVRIIGDLEHLKRLACGNIIVTDQNHLIEPLYELGATHVFRGENFWPELKVLLEEVDTIPFFEASFITTNSSFRREIELTLRTLCQTNLPLLLLGESGTGKTFLAKKIHQFTKGELPFLSKNLREIPDNLLESTLFGHKKGSFTGASENKKGLLELVNGGTLFLDEITGLSPDLQLKLLKVLEEKTFSPVGSNQIIKTNFQLITATCDNIKELLEKKHLRFDFYSRLKGIVLNIPALRERQEDILSLIQEFRKNSARQLYFTDKAKSQILNHPWPGNLRELYFYCETLNAQNKSVINNFRNEEVIRKPLPQAIQELEQKLFSDSYKRNDGKPNKICQELGISKSVFYRLLGNDSLNSISALP